MWQLAHASRPLADSAGSWKSFSPTAMRSACVGGGGAALGVPVTPVDPVALAVASLVAVSLPAPPPPQAASASSVANEAA